MPPNPAPEAPPATGTPNPLRGLQPGRIVQSRDAFGTVRAAIISHVINADEGLVNLVEFGRFNGEEAATLGLQYRYAPDGQGHNRWWWPPKS